MFFVLFKVKTFDKEQIGSRLKLSWGKGPAGKEKEKRNMAKEKLVKNITPRDENFAQWYTDVVREAQLCDYSSVKGCLNYLPNGYAIWELIQADLDRRFKETGVENVYLPTLIPESLLEKEAEHIEGFAPEVAWVTHGGMERLQERMCIRPTSETFFCDLWAKTVRSYRDLPIKIGELANDFR